MITPADAVKFPIFPLLWGILASEFLQWKLLKWPALPYNGRNRTRATVFYFILGYLRATCNVRMFAITYAPRNHKIQGGWVYRCVLSSGFLGGWRMLFVGQWWRILLHLLFGDWQGAYEYLTGDGAETSHLIETYYAGGFR